jgi:hypothetical protein
VVVVTVQDGDHSLHVITDDLGAVVLARYDSADESGHQCELAAEHVVIMSMSRRSKCACSSGFAKQLIINLL